MLSKLCSQEQLNPNISRHSQNFRRFFSHRQTKEMCIVSRTKPPNGLIRWPALRYLHITFWRRYPWSLHSIHALFCSYSPNPYPVLSVISRQTPTTQKCRRVNVRNGRKSWSFSWKGGIQCCWLTSKKSFLYPVSYSFCGMRLFDVMGWVALSVVWLFSWRTFTTGWAPKQTCFRLLNLSDPRHPLKFPKYLFHPYFKFEATHSVFHGNCLAQSSALCQLVFLTSKYFFRRNEACLVLCGTRKVLLQGNNHNKEGVLLGDSSSTGIPRFWEKLFWLMPTKGTSQSFITSNQPISSRLPPDRFSSDGTQHTPAETL